MEKYLGDIYALSTAFCWSVAVIFFKLSSDRLPTVPLKVFQNLIAVVLFFITMLVIQEPLWLYLDGWSWSLIALSAILGITLGDTLYIAAIKRIGASQQAIVDILYAPLVIFFAYIFWGETLSTMTWVGGFLILSAILFAHHDASKKALNKKQLLAGIGFALLSQLAMALCVVLVRDLLRQHSLLTITFYRFAIGTAVLIVFYNFRKIERHTLWHGFHPSAHWPITLTGSILGPYIATLLWFAGFKYTLAGKAAIYNQLSTILIIVLARFFLHEHISVTRFLAIITALFGGVLVWNS